MNLGICNWSSLYKFTDEDLLSEGCKVITNKFNFKTIKIYLGKRSAKIYSIKDINTEVMTLVDIAKLPVYSKIFFNKQIKTVIIVCHSTHRSKSNYWNNELTPFDLEQEENQFHDLATYLRTFPKKTFILQNWESDNYKHKTSISTKNMIRWIKHRQAGVDRFRKIPSNNGTYDNVFHAIEVNKIFDKDSVIHKVIPYVYIDFVSYSCYDSQQNPEKFENAINIILGSINRNRNYCKGIPKCLEKFPVPLYIGEFGVSHKNKKSFQVMNTLYEVITISRKYNIPYANFWNLYNNEKNENFGLIDSSNIITPSGIFFIKHINCY